MLENKENKKNRQGHSGIHFAQTSVMPPKKPSKNQKRKNNARRLYEDNQFKKEQDLLEWL